MSETCGRCSKAVYPQEKIAYDNVAYHKSCFKCLQCTSTITTATSVAKMEGNIYCKNCFKKNFREKGSYNTILTKESSISPTSSEPSSPAPTTQTTSSSAAPVVVVTSASASPDPWLAQAQRDMVARASVSEAPKPVSVAPAPKVEEVVPVVEAIPEDSLPASNDDSFVMVDSNTPVDHSVVEDDLVPVEEVAQVETVEETAVVQEETPVEEAVAVVEEAPAVVVVEEVVAAPVVEEIQTPAPIPEDEPAPKQQDIVAPLQVSTPSEPATPVDSESSPITPSRRDRVGSVFSPTGAGSDICPRCSKRAYPQEKIVYDTVTYHKSCFKCQDCNSVIGASSVAKMEGLIFCRVCFKKAFRTKGSYNTILVKTDADVDPNVFKTR